MSGGAHGLGWVTANVKKMMPALNETKNYQVRWEPVISTGPSQLFSPVSGELDFYFVHSYQMICENDADITSYYLMEDRMVVSSVQKGNIFGVQFILKKALKTG